MKYTLIAFLAFVFCHSMHATPQVGDKLVIEEKVLSVYMFKLSDELRALVEEQRTRGSRRLVRSNNWDGFYADLELREDKLYLSRLLADCPAEEGHEGIAKKVIPLGDEAVFTSWFSGELRSITYGEGRTIERTAHFFFENGVLVDKKGSKGGRSSKVK